MATVKGRNAHVFSRTRPSHGDQYPIHVQADRDTHYRDIPPTPGSPPYHLDLKEIVSEADYQTIVDKKKLTFHLNGDMGRNQVLSTAGTRRTRHGSGLRPRL